MRALFPVKDATYPCARAPCIAFGVNFSPAIWVVAVHVRCPDHVLLVDARLGFISWSRTMHGRQAGSRIGSLPPYWARQDPAVASCERASQASRYLPADDVRAGLKLDQ